MNTNEKIAKWVGVRKHRFVGYLGETYCYINENIDKESHENREVEYLDFLHDRNQQKWIEDKLIELGYGINYTYSQMWKKHFYNIVPKEVDETNIHKYFKGESEISKSIALISAVKQLIDKENGMQKL
ncbi:hypothetical protein A2Z67_02500 [Candidatus Woesebacteria bacterium RBG_13_36_22]|uniref:Uncharacterized protein n=1 Tax=Candidatus Woesebacteria bacterium RBG_13_36_22 TaxID=1802478 RepID=A0A1F7X3H1_9BACT|nr:MAG: hypothetical protein A2Z67_02500 [Candidatus Woesebacteria bacterium RBG_13_36_22]